MESERAEVLRIKRALDDLRSKTREESQAAKERESKLEARLAREAEVRKRDIELHNSACM